MKRLGVCIVLTAATACGATTDDKKDAIEISTNARANASANNVVVTTNGEPNAAPNGEPNATPNGDPNATPNGDPNATPNNSAGDPIALLGNGTHSLDGLDFAVVATSADGLATPRDLEFHPQRTTELWTVNLEGHATVVLDNPGTPEQSYTRYAAPGASHFMARPAAIAFGANGNFASAQEEDELTQGDLTPEDFMGPSLWISDRAIFDGGHGGHLDMLHNSPNGAGVAWERDNRYWIFDGYHASVTMYDFNEDHGPGGSFHGDGEVARYVEGEVGYMGDVPSHMEFDHDAGELLIADTGNNRIATLDPTVGEAGQRIMPNYDGGSQYAMNGGLLETLADGSDVMLERPSGLALHDGVVFVSDNSASRIVGLDRQTGELRDYLDLSGEVPSGGLMGIEIGPDGALWAVNAVDSEIIRIAVP